MTATLKVINLKSTNFVESLDALLCKGLRTVIFCKQMQSLKKSAEVRKRSLDTLRHIGL